MSFRKTEVFPPKKRGIPKRVRFCKSFAFSVVREFGEGKVKRCLSTIAAGSACLGIMPGVAWPSPDAQVYATVDGAWLVPFASTQGMAARLSHTPGALSHPASDVGQHDQVILTSSPMEGGEKCPQKLWAGTCNPVAAESHSEGGQSE